MADPAPGKAEMDRAGWCGMVHMNPDDEPNFILQGVHDFGSSAAAVATEICDDAPANGEVVAAFFTVTEAKAGGTADDDTCIAADTGAAVKMTGELECDMSDTVYSNKVGSVGGVAPSATPTFSKGDSIYAYTNAQTSRSAGKYNVVIVCKKTS